MFKAFRSRRTSVPTGLAIAALATLAACGSDSSSTTYSTPEARVATYSAGGTWTITKRADDKFSTVDSIFATGADGWPVAIRSRGGETTFGHWNGSDWDVETVTTDSPVDIAATDSEDQLYSGIMVTTAAGNPHAMFVTLSKKLYYAGKKVQSDGSTKWVITNLSNVGQTCYDIAVAPDGTPRLLYTDGINDQTVVASLDDSGQPVPSPVLDSSVCGSIAVADNGTVGAVLWIPSDASSTYTARLFEQATGATDWTGTDIATNGNATCSYCYIPELGYRGDNVPVIEYVDNQSGVYMADRAADGSFSKNALAAPGETFQFTRLKRSPDGGMGTAAILNSSNIGVALSSIPVTATDGTISKTFSFTKVAWTGTEANTPRLTFTEGSDGKSHSFVSFWDMDGLYAVPPGGDVAKVDPDANVGYLLGGFVAVGPDGIPQVFYNEMHTES